ncbi:stage V sporulation protein AA [Jeotgalibacillus soli]|uniref:Stage V sporulation protein AA domain-containing protein n=1 Tax=Jeotgalibacillus soli TaxID=889306 RepID=A0A0C2RR70_9BACL|nr:stage V sporulation protein AA [Jeotgalibacillus soli]KIL44254.1 hypothetical protein KP78_32180 [Jeotgalibacillus soli]
MSQTVYLKLRNKISFQKGQTILLKDVVDIAAGGVNERKIQSIPIQHIHKNTTETYVLVEQIDLIRIMKKHLPNIHIEIMGATATLVDLSGSPKRSPLLLFLFVWSLLFVGSGLTIMYFHEDVSMKETQISMVKMMTGEENEYPLWFQIPYSFGLGLGMILFFNHLFQKKFNEEPSPLEVEVYNYEQSLDEYIVDAERKRRAQNNDQ